MSQEDESRIPGERAETLTPGGLTAILPEAGAVALAVVALSPSRLWSMSGEKTPRTSRARAGVVIRPTTNFEPAKEKVEPVRAEPGIKLGDTGRQRRRCRKKIRCSIPPAAHPSWPNSGGPEEHDISP